MKAGVAVLELAKVLQREGAHAFVASWQDLMKQIGSKADTLRMRGEDEPTQAAAGYEKLLRELLGSDAR